MCKEIVYVKGTDSDKRITEPNGFSKDDVTIATLAGGRAGKDTTTLVEDIRSN